MAGICSASAASDATEWNTPGAANPILPGYFADPSIVEHEGKFYLYATLDPWGGETLGCWESDNFRDWTYRVLNWPTKLACTSPHSTGAMVWAPGVIRGPNGGFFMYVSVGSEVWVGRADHPLGLWENAQPGDGPLIPGNYKPGYHMIDAEPFIDDDGTPYLYWGSGWNWVNGRCWAVKLKPDMATFDGEVHDVTPHNGHYFEGPVVVKRHGRYFLTYSDGRTNSDTYCVYYAISDSPLGPFTEPDQALLLSTDHERQIVSPGHHTIFRQDGRDYIAYHRHRIPFVDETAFRQVCVDEITFDRETVKPVQATHSGPAFVQRSLNDRVRTWNVQVTASSEAAPHTARQVLDGNFATRWQAAAADREKWLQLDLGDVRSITRQRLRLEYPWKHYPMIVQSSTDGANWQTLFDGTADRGVTGSPVDLPGAQETRYLKLVFSEALPAEDCSLWEWEIH